MENIYLKQEEFERVFKKHIKSSVYSLSIKTLFGKRMEKKINYHPYYQRNYVWDNSKASFFIESILLGTDIPPLIFFNTGSRIEVIDGRQRYETLKRFKNGDTKLNIKGLTKLPQLANKTFSKLDPDIQNIFLDSKIRIFEFEVLDEPRIDALLEDKIKKEIFRRYNSGITPLNSAEIDNATYDDDEITNTLKEMLSDNSHVSEIIKTNFLSGAKTLDDSRVLQFMRRYLVLSSFPIKTYATGNNRTEILDLLYNVKSNNAEDPRNICDNLIFNIKITEKLISKITPKGNRQLNECLLWAIFILLENGVSPDSVNHPDVVREVNQSLGENRQCFTTDTYYHYKSIIERHSVVAKIFTNIFKVNFALYISDDDFKENVRDMRQSEKEAKLKLDELSSLRVQKPEPSIVPVEEIVNELGSHNYLVRPSYQRQEKINVVKASAIIESIVLGINLPPLFIFKNKNKVKEVIDGQQRLLSILGFMGKQYLNESGEKTVPKINNFKLQRLKILKELNGKRFSDLDFSIQDKIEDFKLSIIEIDSALNENFDPVDLFIRLNNKPYPIKENSFEMWNSFVDKDIIERIKSLTDDNIDWFYIKTRKSDRSSDRMLNEELIALLSYIMYNNDSRPEYTSIGFYKRDNKINCRISDKKDVSTILEKVSTDVELKRNFLSCVKNLDFLIKKLKTKLDQETPTESLNELLSKGSSRRFLVDFYILFQILQRFDPDRLDDLTYSDLQDKMGIIKQEIDNPKDLEAGFSQQNYFERLLNEVSLQ